MLSVNTVRRRASAALAILVLGAGRASAYGPVELIAKLASPGPPRVKGVSDEASISAGGRYVAFTSTSPNLVPGQSDSNKSGDIFLLDRLTGTVTLVSRSTTSPLRTGNEGSKGPKISADGNWVAFSSTATDLVPGQIDANGSPGSLDAFLWQRSTGAITLVSRAASSPVTTGNGLFLTDMDLDLSADGAWVTFQSNSTNLVAGQIDANLFSNDLFLFDRAAGTTALVSHASGSPTTAVGGREARISADGNYVVFVSSSTDVIPGQMEANGTDDVFLYDRAAGTSVLVSHASGSVTTAANASSSAPVINADGRWLSYASEADDLVAGQVSSFGSNVFLYDRTMGTSALLSGANGSATATANGSSSRPSISADGAYVAFESSATNLTAGQTDSNHASDIFLFDRGSGTLALVSGASGSTTIAANSHSISAVISSDGGRIVFESYATNLVSGQSDGNEERDVFLYTRTSASVALVSRGAAPAATGNGFSQHARLDGGGHVVFASVATDLTGASDTNGGSDVFLYTAADASLSALSFSAPVSSSSPDFGSAAMSLSGDGRFVAFQSSSDTKIFLRDRAMGTTTLVSHTFSSATTPGNSFSFNLSLSGDGAYAVFESFADDLVSGTDPSPPFGDPDVFLFDRATGTNTLVSHAPGVPNQAEGDSSQAKISADGSSVVFANAGGNLVPGLTNANSSSNIFLYSRATGENILVSRSSSSSTTTGDRSSQKPVLSADGGFVAFLSFASNLVTGQIQNNSDLNVFLFDRAAERTALVSHAASATTSTGNAGETDPFFPQVPAISADGAYVAFASRATDHVAGQIDTNLADDVFLWERATGAITLVSHASASAVTSGNGFSESPSISADGRYIAFVSRATDLVPGQTDTNGKDDVFLYDRISGTTTLVSHAPGSATTTAAGSPWNPIVSADGSAIAFNSDAANLESGQVDDNSTSDIFLYDRLSGANRLLSHAVGSMQRAGNADSFVVQISADGSTVAFNSEATDLVAGDYNDSSDAFVHDGRGLDFYTLMPCRLLDTRTPEGGPALVSGVTETFVLAGACGIPANARALALNITVTQGSGGGHLTVFPGDLPLAPSTSTINFQTGQTRANNAILALSGDGSLAITPAVSGGGTVHVILDVVGYFLAGTN